MKEEAQSKNAVFIETRRKDKECTPWLKPEMKHILMLSAKIKLPFSTGVQRMLFFFSLSLFCFYQHSTEIGHFRLLVMLSNTTIN